MVEVLIGIIFLAIGLLAVAGMIATSARGNFSSNNVMVATYAAQDRLEFLKNLPLASPSLTVGTHNDGSTQVSAVFYQSLVFNRFYAVTLVAGPSGNYLRIDYTVSWNDRTNHSIAFNTMRAD